MQVTERFHPNFEGEHSGYGQRSRTSLPLLPTSPENLRLDGYLTSSEIPSQQLGKRLEFSHVCRQGVRSN
ncbi:hypothetical protein TNCV_1831531 [Trichonephila clavipes]|nr:hypothetical protein TNCV_1831531 [Trichonephila clavipes]